MTSGNRPCLLNFASRGLIDRPPPMPPKNRLRVLEGQSRNQAWKLDRQGAGKVIPGRSLNRCGAHSDLKDPTVDLPLVEVRVIALVQRSESIKDYFTARTATRCPRAGTSV